ncbi:O-antigen ligase family protein [Micromonospora sp. WMMD1120]|uniref:O-antigen ligase family protein n=1 Tax=Micromonospora sp. WMMD1120 TaxID=3016106 RepID=UPI00241637B0|nr:O-antigen ligase family protein [Micromonospora sp. WMMD1120]MDG4809019.1 O-antigen ligase family protein [Micromonospora sp. WMMD1120]
MVERLGLVALVVGAACLTAVTTALAVGEPMIAAGVGLLLVALYLSRRLDGFQRILAVATVLLVCASSNMPALVSLSFYARYVAVGCLVLWALAERRRQIRQPDHPTRLFVGALWAAAGLATLSSVWSVSPLHTLQQAIALVLLAALAHVLLWRRWVDGKATAADLHVVYVLLSTSLVVSLGYGITGVAAATSFSDRFQGLYSNPNMLSIICALTIPLGWALYRQSHRRVQLIGIVPAIILLPMTESRTALIAVVVGGLWVLLRHGAGPVARLLVVTVGAVGLAYLFGMLPSVLGSTWLETLAARFTDPDNGDLSNGRSQTWQATVELWQSRPALGFGYASGIHLFEQTRQDGFFDVSVNLVHNSYLQWLLELGVIGLAPILLLLFVAIRVVLLAPVGALNSGLLWLIVTGLLIQVTESTMFGMGQPYPYVFWLSVAGALVRARAGRHATGVPATVFITARPDGRPHPHSPVGRRQPTGGPGRRERVSVR